jgi:hypothetical protein
MTVQTEVDRFEVRTDRAALRRTVRRATMITLISNAVLMAVIGVLVGAAINVLDSFPVALALGGLVSLVGFANGCVQLGMGPMAALRQRQALDRVMVVDRAGIWIAAPQTDAGSAFLPWPVVGAVGPRRRPGSAVVTVRVRPGVQPDHPGAYGLGDPLIWKWLNGPGLQVGTKGATATGEDIIAAIDHYQTAARQPDD